MEKTYTIKVILGQHSDPWINNPIKEAIHDAVYDIVVGAISPLPDVFTILGMLFFLATMALGNGKPYWYGIVSWAASAIAKVVYNGLAN